MNEKEAGRILSQKYHQAILDAQAGKITGQERNRIMEEAVKEYQKNIKEGKVTK